MNAASPPRFVALDSLRGVCACIVALYHFRTSGLSGSLLFQHGWLFVDFFFVLSGFVIAAGYGKRLAEGFPIRWFMLMRLGRVYPLYVVMILAFLATEAIGLLVASTRVPFSPPRTLDALFENFALIQIFGMHDTLSWNPPGWSIAAEVWAYLLAALLLRFASRWRVPLLVVAVLGAALTLFLLGTPFLDRTFAWGLVRCIYGFGLGMLCWEIHRASGARTHAPYRGATLLEIAVVLAVGALVIAAEGALTLAWPPMFMLAVLVFAREGGAVSRWLRWLPFVLLGTLSYSIYMVHHFLQAHIKNLFTLIARLFDVTIIHKVPTPKGMIAVISGPGPVPDLIALAMLAIVVGCAWVTWRWIEEPMRRWSRGYAARHGAGGAERIAPAL